MAFAEDGGGCSIDAGAGTDQRRGPGRGEELTVFPVEKTAVLILFGPLLT